eukprot:scpid53933/ scgid24362/ [Pyruvate dehydrogenase [acetyl-transferring]]-phosphatase 2, mitochondrial; Pyruvate dehydrogenase phosphatase catalytic subunit 2
MARLGSWVRKNRIALAAASLGMTGSALFLQGRAAGSSPVAATWKEALTVFRQYQSATMVNRSRIHSFHVGHVASNSPAEDRHVQAHLKPCDSYLFSIIDGHSGWECAQRLQERLPFYLSCALSPRGKVMDVLPVENWFNRLTDSKSLLAPPVAESDSTQNRFSASASQFNESVVKSGEMSTLNAIKMAVQSVDEDFSNEALGGDKDAVRVVASGAVAASALVHGNELYLANTGDCRIVLGTKNASGPGYVATPLTTDHTVDNTLEVARLRDGHPGERGVIAYGRLLGSLQPLRAFGDFVYKWPYDVVRRMFGTSPPNYLTPPYLTCEPEIRKHKLTDDDSFMILATDGLWDDLSPSEVVDIVGRHYNVLRQQAKRPVDMEENAATDLIIRALQSTCREPDTLKQQEYAAALLKLPAQVRRRYYDDITVVVVFFENESK